MPQALCRCGHPLTLPSNPNERVVCANCGARVRVRVHSADQPPADGYIRFFCECGRRLKVPARNRPTHGQCPDCGRIVPIPELGDATSLPPGHPETPTAELAPADREVLEQWSKEHLRKAAEAGREQPDTDRIAAMAPAPPQPEPSTMLSSGNSSPARVEVGLRTCPNCGRPIHIQAETCRGCGTRVPRR
jgi:hypothetical protein